MKETTARHPLFRILQWALALFFMGWAFLCLWQQRSDLGVSLTFRPLTLIIILVLYLAYYALHSWRFQLIMQRSANTRIPYRPWFRIFILGRFLNFFIPQSGNIYRGMTLKRDYQVTYTEYIGAFLAFSWIDACFNLALASVLVGWLRPDLRAGSVPLGAWLGGCTVIILAAPFAIALSGRLLGNLSERTRWLADKMKDMLRIARRNVSNIPFLCGILLLGVAILGITCAIFYTCFQALGVVVDWPFLLVFYTVFKAGTYLNITPGNVGIRELAYGLISELEAGSMAGGILTSAIMRVFNFLVVSVLALCFGGAHLLIARRHDTPTGTPADAVTDMNAQ